MYSLCFQNEKMLKIVEKNRVPVTVTIDFEAETLFGVPPAIFIDLKSGEPEKKFILKEKWV